MEVTMINVQVDFLRYKKWKPDFAQQMTVWIISQICYPSSTLRSKKSGNACVNMNELISNFTYIQLPGGSKKSEVLKQVSYGLLP